MSKYNNVNPGQYKVAGRARPGEDIVQSAHKQRLAKNREEATPPKKRAPRKRSR
jgi:hypothetical protein